MGVGRFCGRVAFVGGFVASLGLTTGCSNDGRGSSDGGPPEAGSGGRKNGAGGASSGGGGVAGVGSGGRAGNPGSGGSRQITDASPDSGPSARADAGTRPDASLDGAPSGADGSPLRADGATDDAAVRCRLDRTTPEGSYRLRLHNHTTDVTNCLGNDCVTDEHQEDADATLVISRFPASQFAFPGDAKPGDYFLQAFLDAPTLVLDPLSITEHTEKEGSYYGLQVDGGSYGPFNDATVWSSPLSLSPPLTGSPSIDVNFTLDLTTGTVTSFHRTYELGVPGWEDRRNEQTGTGVLDCAATAECMNDAAHCSQ